MSNTVENIRTRELNRSIKQVVKGKLCGNCFYRVPSKKNNRGQSRGGVNSPLCKACNTDPEKPSYRRGTPTSLVDTYTIHHSWIN